MTGLIQTTQVTHLDTAVASAKRGKNNNYHVDLLRQQRLCDTNYACIARLIPAHGLNSRTFSIPAGQKHSRITLTIIERSRYTSLLRVDQVDSRSPDNLRNGHTSMQQGWQPQTLMTIRLYHDVRMAEVIAFNKQRYFHSRYDYPNPKMHQPDEKLQINQFLADWLQHCLTHGYHSDPIQFTS